MKTDFSLYEVLHHWKGSGTWFQLTLDILAHPWMYWRIWRALS